jgi:hypothetical protein
MVLADFFPGRTWIDHSADFRPNIELNLDVSRGRPATPAS